MSVAVKLLSRQAQVFRSKATTAAMFGGYGAGKTYLLCVLAMYFSRRFPGVAGGFAAPSYTALQRDVLPLLYKLMSEWGVEFDENKGAWIRPSWMRGEGRIYFASCANFHALKGPNWAWALLNEPGIVSRESYDALVPRARVPLPVCESCELWRGEEPDLLDEIARRKLKARSVVKWHRRCRRCGDYWVEIEPNYVRLAGTPEGLNWLYEELVNESNPRHAGRDWSDVLRVYAPTWTNPYVSASVTETLKGQFDPLLAQEKLGAQFLNTRTGRIYYQFDRPLHTQKYLPEYDPRLPLLLCCDFNVQPLEWSVAQRHGRHIWVIDQVILPLFGQTPEAMAEFCERWIVKRNHRAGVVVYGDASGTSRDTRGRDTDYSLIRKVAQRYGVQPFSIDVPPEGNPARISRYAAVNGMLKNVLGETRLWIHPHNCPSLIRDFEQQGFKPGSDHADDQGGKVGHSADGVGYLVHRLFPVEGPGVSAYRLAS